MGGTLEPDGSGLSYRFGERSHVAERYRRADAMAACRAIVI
jgi:hypothetical protein